MRVLMAACCAALLLTLAAPSPAAAQNQSKKNQVSSVRITVTVVDPGGNPVQNAGVVLRQEKVRNRIPKDPFNVEIHTNEHGQASVSGFEPGIVLVQVIAHGFQTWGQGFIMEHADEAVHVKLDPPQSQVTIYGKKKKGGGGGR
jgi:hypothetical protein